MVIKLYHKYGQLFFFCIKVKTILFEINLKILYLQHSKQQQKNQMLCKKVNRAGALTKTIKICSQSRVVVVVVYWQTNKIINKIYFLNKY